MAAAGANFVVVAIKPFSASGNKNIGATIRIGQEILCLPCAGILSSGPDTIGKDHRPVNLGGLLSCQTKGDA